MRKARSTRRASLAMAAVVALAAVTTACAKTPDQDAFYTAPSSGSASAGTVLRSRTSKLAHDVSVKSWQVVYRSTDAAGVPMDVSGTVLVPGSAWAGPGPRPVVTYGVGSRGIGDACAPSYTLANGGDYEGGFISALLGKGWAVVVTDMQGLGTPGLHTYMVGKSQGRAALDGVRAALRLAGTGLQAGAPVGVWGYSQGGATAAWASELARTYAPELNIKGAVMGGVPADLLQVAIGLDGTQYVALGLLAAVGYDAAYPELNLNSYLNDRGRQLTNDVKNLCLVSLGGLGTFMGVANSSMTDFVTTDPRSTPLWQQRLGENRLGSGTPSFPILQYHGETDTTVVYPQAMALRDRYCANGVNVTWKSLPNTDHVGGIFGGQDTALGFLGERFAGVPTAGTC